MATNLIQAGKKTNHTNAGGAIIKSGDLVVIGKRVGVAQVDIAIGESGSVAMTEVYEVPKEAALAVAQGEELYCDATSGELDKTDAGQTLAGYAFEAAAAEATTVIVKLNA